ncbi:hypothetical protein [Endozoicomonas sp. 2B-B]
MKASGKSLPLFLCLQFLCSIAYSGLSKQEQLNLLSHYSNTTLVEDGLKLATSSSGLVISTVINYGLWYSICRSPEVISALVGRSDLSGTEQNEQLEFKSSFCNQLAAVVTSTEIALAGHVSLWPPETPWWQPLRFVATAYSGYLVYTDQDPYYGLITTAAYLTHEVMARTVAAIYAARALRYQDRGKIEPLDYARSEYSFLSTMAGTMVGTAAYNRMVSRGATTFDAISAYLISALLIEQVLAIGSSSAHNSGAVDSVEAEAKALAGIGAITGSLATGITGVATVGLSSDVYASLITFAKLFISMTKFQFIAKDAVLAGIIAGTGYKHLLVIQSFVLDSNHLWRNIAVTISPALGIALMNGFSKNILYGHTLEESLTETIRNQWQKFHAPLRYLHTLFN